MPALSRYAFCFILLTTTMVFGQNSRPVYWNVDPLLSSLTFSASFFAPDNNLFATTSEQGQGSVTAALSGSARTMVDFDDSGFLLGFGASQRRTGLAAQPNGNWAPGNWGSSGTSPASFGAIIDAGLLGKALFSLREFSAGVYTETTPLQSLGSGQYSFDANSATINWESRIDYLGLPGTIFGSGWEYIESPTDASLHQAGAGSVVINDSVMTLTLPVHQTQVVETPLLPGFRGEVVVTGQIVATAATGALTENFPNGSFESLGSDWSLNGASITTNGAFPATDGNNLLAVRGVGFRDYYFSPEVGPQYYPVIIEQDSPQVQFVGREGDVLSLDYYIETSQQSLFGDVSISIQRGGSAFVPIVADSPWISSTNGWASAAIRLDQDGLYTLRAQSSLVPYEQSTEVIELGIDNIRLSSLGDFENPSMPTTTVFIPGSEVPVFVFTEVPTGQWFDPPIASGFLYKMTGDSLFTQILDFPPGFDDPFQVYVGNQLLGSFLPGQAVDFVDLLGQGVSSFKVSGIAPLVDPEDPLAFPLKLAFNTPTASFTMQAVPEIHSWALGLLVMAVVLTAALVHRRRSV